MAFSLPPSTRLVSRRRFLTTGLCSAAGLALYSGEIERHWVAVSHRDVYLPGLSAAFDGMRIAQISDIHMDEFTEPFFLRHVVDRINGLKPDAVFLTGDFVTANLGSMTGSTKFERGAAWQCANILTGLECRALYAVLGNHDFGVGAKEVASALAANGIAVLRNGCVPIERAGGRFWLAGLDDPLDGHPNPELAIPPSIRNVPNEPVVLLCHAPDYADRLLTHPVGRTVDLMLCGHTHGGQIRLPLIGAMVLPPLGRKYIQGWFKLGRLQLHVNRGIGTIGLPFRFDCPPEITSITLRAAG
ncbi:MAG TPA: metallophosphoesterase [Terracidiphilus sp.]|nr:metallophosphoesterase [Terracidiphilus sp.]